MSSSGTRSRRRRSGADAFAPSRNVAPTPRLVSATDLGLLAALWLVPICLGGRVALGQAVLIAAAVWSAGCWSLHQFTSSDAKWIWTRCEWLFAAAIALVMLQLAELPQDWLDSLSPQHGELLTEWRAGSVSDRRLPERVSGEVLNHRWATLSFAPHETRSSLATFLALALLFYVAAQRFRERRDIERMLKWVAIVTVAIAGFSLLQYASGSSRFFGVVQHPFSNPQRYNLGPFTNRNHLAQFLAMGVPALLWWWLTRTRGADQKKSAGDQFAAPAASNARMAAHLVFVAALATVAVAALLSLSRGGLLAMGVAGIVAMAGYHRARLVSAQFVLGLIAAGVVIGGLAWASGSQELADRIDESAPDERWPIWKTNVEIVRHFPWVGTGVGTHPNSHQLYLDREYNGREYTHADNSYLQVASECGFAGLTIAGLALLTCFGWVRGVLRRNTDASTTAIAAAIAGSLAGNSVHAVFDFLWYVPGLMVVVALLAAGARRLSQIDLENCGGVTPALPAARLCWAMAGCGVMALAPWMWAQKADAIAAEPHRIHYLNLTFVPWHVFPLDDEPETQVALKRARARAAVQAAKFDLRNGDIQLAASAAYRQTFDVLQEHSENPMTLVQLRDVVQAGGFESVNDVRDWIARASGKNARLLDASWTCALRTVENSPLEGQAYVYLAELSFLHDPTGQLQDRLLKQALAVRPYDPHVLFAVGQQALLRNREDEAMTHWKRAFRYGPLFQKRIADILAIEKSADFFLQEFAPDWEAQGRICESLRQRGREDELPKMLESYAEAAVAFAREHSDDALSMPAWIAARHAWLERLEPERAIATLREAVKRHPHSLELRTALGTDLYHQQQFSEAAKHLRWAAGRKPDDEALQNLAKRAIRGELETPAAPPERVTPTGFTLPQ